MNNCNDKKPNINRKPLLGGMIAAVILALILMTPTVFAWLNNARKAAAIAQISDPTALFITAGHQEEIKYLNLGGIDVEDEGTELPEDSHKKYKDYVLCIKGIGVISYNIQIAHTTNNQFEFQLYAATETAGGPLDDCRAYVPFIIHDASPGETMQDNSGDTVPVSEGDTVYYSIPYGGTAIAMTPLNKKTDALLGKDDDTYYTKTYDGYSASNVNQYAVPIYWHTASPRNVVDSDSEFHHYFILRVIWPEDAENDKETDILYISAKNSNS